jgi:hypothetical protein
MRSVEQIQKFATLKDQGLITEEEFAAKKRQILGISRAESGADQLASDVSLRASDSRGPIAEVADSTRFRPLRLAA